MLLPQSLQLCRAPSLSLPSSVRGRTIHAAQTAYALGPFFTASLVLPRRHASSTPLLNAASSRSTTRKTAAPSAREEPTSTSSTSSPSPPSAARWAAALPDIPYGFPTESRDALLHRAQSALHTPPSSSSTTTTTFPAQPGTTAAAHHPFTAEQSGGLQKSWLQRLPHRVATAQVTTQHYLPRKDDFWRSPPYEALREVVLRTAYHDALKIIMEHDYTFLFADVMCNEEAPMPHVIYEDFMQVLTFSSRQRPPEEQFALPETVLRDLLCWAAYYCTLDPFYFTSASLFFRKVEQEQHLSPALHSAWVYICTAAGRVDEALAYAVYMDQHNIAFDPAVFSFMLHPSLTPPQHHLHQAPQTSRGVVLQRRLCQDMNQHHGTTPVAVHAMFVYHMLTLRHTRKWEVLRAAAELATQQRHSAASAAVQEGRRSDGPSTASLRTAQATVTVAALPEEFICSRTMQLALSVFSSEKGIRWGPRTAKAMVSFMLADAAAGATMADVLFVLMRVRRNERTALLAGLPRTVFDAAEQDELMHLVARRSRGDPACLVAAPLLKELFAAGSASGDEGNRVRDRELSRSGKDASAEALQTVAPPRGSDAGILRALHELQKLSASAAERQTARVDFTCPAPRSSGKQEGAQYVATKTPSTFNAALSLFDDDSANYDAIDDAVASAFTAGAGMEAPQQQDPAEVARELLEAVMALDRQSTQRPNAVQQHAAATPSSAPSDTSTAPLSDTTAAAAVSPAAEAEMERLAALQSSMAALGASASLVSWSMQQAEEEAAEARLRAQVGTAWIAPTYQP